MVTPATPTAFETRNTGVTLEIEPTLGGNDYVIDLKFAPEIVEFEGFINYGSPINAVGVSSSVIDPLNPFLPPIANPGGDNDAPILLTENRIEMPVFSARRIQSPVTIYDGHTIAVGGLMREDTQDVEDKVPILGSIPYVGRLFQSSAERTIKSNLIIFVTARVIDATGTPIRGTEAFSDGSSQGATQSVGVLPPITQ